MLRLKFVELLMSILKWQFNSSSNFESFFINMTPNFSVNFKLIHFLLWIKGSHQSPSFETFKCSGENLPNFSCHFPNYKSVFLQILYHSSVSWKITPLYFFRSNIIYFAQKESIKVQMFETFECWDFRVLGSTYIKFQQQASFSSNFASLFSIMRHNSYVCFGWNLIYFQQKDPIKTKIWKNFMPAVESLTYEVLAKKKYRRVISHETGECCKSL